jgi:hypothetical protein
MTTDDAHAGAVTTLAQGDPRLLDTEVARRLLASTIPARLAYAATDGTPVGPALPGRGCRRRVPPADRRARHPHGTHRGAPRLGRRPRLRVAPPCGDGRLSRPRGTRNRRTVRILPLRTDNIDGVAIIFDGVAAGYDATATAAAMRQQVAAAAEQAERG